MQSQESYPNSRTYAHILSIPNFQNSLYLYNNTTAFESFEK